MGSKAQHNGAFARSSMHDISDLSFSVFWPEHP